MRASSAICRAARPPVRVDVARLVVLTTRKIRRRIKFIFSPLEARRAEAEQHLRWAHERGMLAKVHTSVVSRSGASQMCGFATLEWLQPDVAAHVSGGPIPMPDEDIDRLVDPTRFALEVCESGNDRSTLRLVRCMAKRGQLARLTLGTDTPGGTGVIPRGMLRTLIDTSSKRALGGRTYRGAPPGGRNCDTFPVNANEAKARRFGRFRANRHTADRSAHRRSR